MEMFVGYVVIGLIVGFYAWIRHGADRWPPLGRLIGTSAFLFWPVAVLVLIVMHGRADKTDPKTPANT